MVGPPGDFPLLLGNAIEIQPGHNNMISLSVAKISADTSIKESVDPVKRNCIFPEETRNTFYTTFFAEIFALDYIVLFPLWTEWISTSQDLLGRQFSSQLYPLTRIMVYERRSFIDSIGIYFVVAKSFWIGNSSF